MPTGLGRGLDSLIPQKIKKVTTPGGDTIVSVTSVSDLDRVIQVPPESISVNPQQPRKQFDDSRLAELIESIKLYGIIQPLIVTKKAGGYELIAGERRLRSSKKIGLKTVPVIVREAADQEKLELALIENIQREQLNPIETAIAYRKLMDEFSLTQDSMAKRVGKSRSSVANSLRYLSLPEEIQNAMREGRLTEGHAKLIAGLDNEVKQMALYRNIIHSGMSVSDTAAETKKMGGTKKAKAPINHEDRETELRLQRHFGTKVDIKRKGSTGQIVIHFFSEDEMKGVLGKMQ